ncbi:hypothetical protein BT69DRAFT_1331717 [Atractiella rhizophila]|nr:hypothetical protein BT69DRAFT_1331717 [Atractiella rhizophila]
MSYASTFVSEKLNDTNYAIWSEEIFAFLQTKRAGRIILGTETRPVHLGLVHGEPVAPWVFPGGFGALMPSRTHPRTLKGFPVIAGAFPQDCWEGTGAKGFTGH